MEVILKQDIDNLGHTGDIVTVRPGYARNFLIPQGMAVTATPSAKKMREETMRQRAHKEAKILEEAQALASKLAGVKLLEIQPSSLPTEDSGHFELAA